MFTLFSRSDRVKLADRLCEAKPWNCTRWRWDVWEDRPLQDKQALQDPSVEGRLTIMLFAIHKLGHAKARPTGGSFLTR